MLKDFVKWNTRVSAVYALGIWTMVGSYAYFKYTGRYDDPTEQKKEEEEVEEPADPNTHVYVTAHSKTTVTYKKDFVPFTTRIYNYVKSFSEPGAADK
ncbi:small integral membrane protein 26-like [Oryzias latipes]|uniref:small integral membrane protein 26-like n=1 Tax=Oryzias latipes TaxID=8090 RepID=UPI000CE18606|nr:small integral membrane protein 26-like [Oryzias latipes]